MKFRLVWGGVQIYSVPDFRITLDSRSSVYLAAGAVLESQDFLVIADNIINSLYVFDR